MTHIDAIDSDLKNAKNTTEIVRKIYLTYPTIAFEDNYDTQYEILNDISTFFRVPITAIQIAGSSKTGYSFHKQQAFQPGISDLDIAIIDSTVFLKYMELVFHITDGYRLGQHFPIDTVKGGSSKDSYMQYIGKGIFAAEYMPQCPERAEWRSFFGELSKKHTKLFKSINARLYLSQKFFENKQRNAIEIYASNKEKII